MKQNNFIFLYIMMTLAQILICNYFNLSQYILLSILPAIILCIPTKIGTTGALFIAFFSGLAVDLLAEGIIGLNILSIVPVAFARKSILRLIFGDELFSRKENFSIKKNGIGAVSFAILIAQTLFLIVYLWADSAGTRPFWFNVLRFPFSLISGYLLSLIVVNVLCREENRYGFNQR